MFVNLKTREVRPESAEAAVLNQGGVRGQTLRWDSWNVNETAGARPSPSHLNLGKTSEVYW